MALRERRKKLDLDVDDREEVDSLASSLGQVQREVHDLRGSFWLTRVVFLRSLALIYFVAFLIALHQVRHHLLSLFGLCF